jgi:DNA polymerase III delta prime subunit
LLSKEDYFQKARNELGNLILDEASQKWTKSKIRDEVMEYRTTANNCIGVRAKLAVVL